MRHTWVSLTFVLLHNHYVHPQECQSELPKMPEYFVANMQYNSKTDIRSVSQCAKSQSCHKLKYSRTEGPIAGKSVALSESTDQRFKLSSVTARIEIQGPENDTLFEPMIIQETIVWNEELTGIAAFVNHIIEGPEELCIADNTASEGPLDWIFGLQTYCAVNETDCTLTPSVVGMLHAKGCWMMQEETKIIRGVDCRVYTLTKDGIDHKYYWSDPEHWTGSGGLNRSVPIALTMAGEYIDPSTGTPTSVDIEIDFQEFFEIEAPRAKYWAPQYLYCEGRQLTESIPHQFPQAYHFGSELVLVHQIGDEHAHKVITSRKEWYDFAFNISRVDYKPMDHSNPEDPENNPRGVVSEVMDFTVGLKYTIEKSTGNCTISKLTLDPFVPGDVTVDAEGNIIMQSPIQFFHMDQKFAYNGEFYDRGIKMDVFVSTHEVGKDDYKMNETVLVYVASSEYFIVEAGTEEMYVPTKIIQYPTDKYYDYSQRRTYNIEHFAESNDEAQTANKISSCYELDEMIRLAITFPVKAESDLDNSKRIVLRESILLIALTGHVAPMRIINVETVVLEGTGTFDLLFTIVGPPAIEIGEQDIPIEYYTTNQEVKNSLGSAVDQGTFTLFILGDADDSQLVYNETAVGGSMREIDVNNGGGLAGGLGENNKVSYDHGYSSGSMAGLAFGMIGLGMVVAVGVYAVFFRNNIRAGLPVLRSFDNPLTGLTGISK